MKTIVVKVGSNILTTEYGINDKRIGSIAKAVSTIHEMGYSVAVVSSGAVVAGKRKLHLDNKNLDIKLKQASAAVGQSSLIRFYERRFAQYGKMVAQILITQDAFDDRRRYINAKNTIQTLFSFGIIPVINENDTVAVDEIKFGDNDRLASLVAGMLGAERLFILSDVEGLFDKDPKRSKQACLIEKVDEISDELMKVVGNSTSSGGTGGMYSKMLAAKHASENGITVNILGGKRPANMVSILEGKNHGTLINAKIKRLSSRKGWIAHGIKAKGSLSLDAGAIDALMEKGKSLLPSGIVSVTGTFDIGDAVNCEDNKGNKVAKGLTNYSSSEINRIKGKKTSEIEKELGYRYSDEVIHRDNLVKL
ncbi:MAG: glutamate 5-kinase [Nitrospirota bacterium]|nr:MAG: glutamate 5-kinase [Nitrospirota bacterium]